MSILRLRKFRGHFYCKSSFGCYYTTCNEFKYEFDYGVYILIGEIDSGGWSFSYALSSKEKKDVILDEFEMLYRDKEISLDEIREKSCYLSHEKEHNSNIYRQYTLKQIIERNLRKNDIGISAEQVRKIFCIEERRFEAKLSDDINVVMRSKAAIGFSENKEIYCFPWISSKFMRTRKFNIENIIEILKNYNKIVFLPTSYEFTPTPKYVTIKFGYSFIQPGNEIVKIEFGLYEIINKKENFKDNFNPKKEIFGYDILEALELFKNLNCYTWVANPLGSLSVGSAVKVTYINDNFEIITCNRQFWYKDGKYIYDGWYSFNKEEFEDFVNYYMIE